MSAAWGAGGLPGGHIAGIPIEETIGAYGPALVLLFGAAMVTLRARLNRVRANGHRPAARRDRGEPGDDGGRDLNGR